MKRVKKNPNPNSEEIGNTKREDPFQELIGHQWECKHQPENFLDKKNRCWRKQKIWSKWDEQPNEGGKMKILTTVAKTTKKNRNWSREK